MSIKGTPDSTDNRPKVQRPTYEERPLATEYDVDLAMRIVERAELRELFSEWIRDYRSQNPATKAGRPPTLQPSTVVALLLVLQMERRPLHLVQLGSLLYCGLTVESQRRLGITVNPIISADNWFERCRRAWNRLEKAIDPDPRPGRQKRATVAGYDEAKKKRNEDLHAPVRALRRDQLANALIEATLSELPEAYRPAAYTVAFDATPLPEFARGVGRSRKNALGPNEKLSSEPEAGFYARHTEDHADDGSQPMTKVKYAFELDILVGMHPDPNRTSDTPMLALGIAHHKPGEKPGANALKVLEGTLKRGHVIKEYIADRAYLPGAKVEDLQRHLFDHGIAVVMDYKKDEFGIQAQHEGMILVDGRWYSPSMPEELRNLGAEWAAARERHDSLISRGKPSTMPDFTDRFELRAMYEFRPKEKPDQVGNTPMMCPAVGPGSTVWCPLKAFVPKADKFPVQRVPAFPLKACTNRSSITVPRDADGGRALKYRQDFAYGTREWQLHYGRRNLVESFNWSIKGESGINLHVASNRRVRGATSKYLFAAVGVAVANLDKIQKFVHQKERDEIDKVLEKVGMAPMARSGKSGRHHQLVHRKRVAARILQASELVS